MFSTAAQFLFCHFPISESYFLRFGHSNVFLGIEFPYPSNKLVLNQWKYMLDILTKIGLLGCKP